MRAELIVIGQISVRVRVPVVGLTEYGVKLWNHVLFHVTYRNQTYRTLLQKIGFITIE